MNRHGLTVAIGLALAGCGDNLVREDLDVVAAVSGTRLALQKYRFDDGTELVSAVEMYDTALHVRCTDQTWIDGSVRCVPSVDTAVYVDAACSTLVGVAVRIARPSYFVVFDAAIGHRIPSRLFRAGAVRGDLLTQSYSRSTDGTCLGPNQVPSGILAVYDLGDELDGFDLVELHGDEVGDASLGLRLLRGDDGLRLPQTLHDRQLDRQCLPQVQSDGSVRCEPLAVDDASFFGDSLCRQPVAAVLPTPVMPVVARVVEATGCVSYHSVGDTVSAPIYQRIGTGTGSACIPAAPPTNSALFAVAAPLALPTLSRSLEDAGRRLQRVVLDHAGVRFIDTRLFDTMRGSDCTLRTLRNELRCIPTNTISATTLLMEGCAAPVQVAEVPQHGCQPLGYAIAQRPFALRPIGDPVTAPVYQLTDSICQRYTPAAGNELRSLGAPLDITAFSSAIYFSDRSL